MGHPEKLQGDFSGKGEIVRHPKRSFCFAKQAKLSTHFDALRGGTIKNTNPLYGLVFFTVPRESTKATLRDVCK